MKTFNHWNFFAVLFPIIGTLCHAQIVTTYDTRFGVEVVPSQYLAVDIATTDRSRNPDYIPLYRSIAAPALIDSQLVIGVTITGTIAQAEADLAKSVSNQYPATVRLKGVDRRQYAESGRTNSNNGAAAMRVDLTKLFEMVAEINERLERLEAQ